MAAVATIVMTLAAVAIFAGACAAALTAFGAALYAIVRMRKP